MNWAEGAQTGEPEAEGWLLYAAVAGEFDYGFELMGRMIRVCCVDLGQEWRVIERRLKDLVAGMEHSIAVSA